MSEETMDAEPTPQMDPAFRDLWQAYCDEKERANAAEARVAELESRFAATERVVEVARAFVMDDPTYLRPDSTDYENLTSALAALSDNQEGAP